MYFFKRLFAKARKRGFDTGVWTTMCPSDIVERNLLPNNKEWVYIAVDKVAKAVASAHFKVMRYQSNGDDQEVFSSIGLPPVSPARTSYT